MKVLFGLFLIAHGLIHGLYLAPKPDDPTYPFDFSKGWFMTAGATGRSVGMALAVIALVGFVLGGLGLLGTLGLGSLWKVSVGVGIMSSCLLMILFWHPWLMVGLAINIILIYIFVAVWTFGSAG